MWHDPKIQTRTIYMFANRERCRWIRFRLVKLILLGCKFSDGFKLTFCTTMFDVL